MSWFDRALRGRCAISAATLLGMATIACAETSPRIGIYTSSPRTFNTASYWIEGNDGVGLIDTQFLPAEGLAAAAEAERATGKKVVLAIVLHSNPDKFNGTAVLQARGIRVITARPVAAAIPTVHAIRLGWFFDEYKPDYPRDPARPEVFGEKTTSIDVAGLRLRLHVLGSGCSAAHLVVQADDAVFTGDLVNPDNHAWLELGLIDPWLQRLDDMRALQPKRIYPGRGKAGGIELLERQAGYLHFVQHTVQDRTPSGALDFVSKWWLSRRIIAAYPDLGYPNFMRDGLDAVWRVEAAKQPTRRP